MKARRDGAQRQQHLLLRHVEELKKEWSSENNDNVASCSSTFFRYFSKEFSYARDVIILKSETGLLSKDSKSWTAELCIEDPFQMGYNVSRTVTKDGLYTSVASSCAPAAS